MTLEVAGFALSAVNVLVLPALYGIGRYLWRLERRLWRMESKLGLEDQS
ncbi:hypothetical protein [Pandoraea norimbergensis]|nr:hypothetical protein [Pandoraea norimbergensis]